MGWYWGSCYNNAPAQRKANARLGGWVSQKGQTSVPLTHNIFTPGEQLRGRQKLDLLGHLLPYRSTWVFFR